MHWKVTYYHDEFTRRFGPGSGQGLPAPLRDEAPTLLAPPRHPVPLHAHHRRRRAGGGAHRRGVARYAWRRLMVHRAHRLSGRDDRHLEGCADHPRRRRRFWLGDLLLVRPRSRATDSIGKALLRGRALSIFGHMLP